MPHITRRAALAGLAIAPLAKPGIIRAQSTSKPVKIGLLSDMSGPYRDVGGPGNKVAVELAIEDFGGSVLGRPIEVLQADDQNKPDVAAAAGARMDRQPGRRCADRRGGQLLRPGGAADRHGEEADLSDHRAGHLGHDGAAMHAVRDAFLLRHLRAGQQHRQRADQGGRRYAGSSSPPTMRSATRWSATRSTR